MPPSLIDFEWLKSPNPTDYQLVPKKLTGAVHYHQPALRPTPNLPTSSHQWGLAYHPLAIIVLDDAKGKAYKPFYVVRHDGDLKPYRPLERFGSLLVTEFTKLSTADDVLHFIRRFGALTKAGQHTEQGELVKGVLAHARGMRELLDYQTAGREHKAELVATQTNPISELEVTLDFDPTSGALTMRYTPSSLLDAIWLQAVQMLQGGAVVRQCRHCGDPFEAGAYTGRRLDAKFCSDEHKIAFHSLKRSREK